MYDFYIYASLASFSGAAALAGVSLYGLRARRCAAADETDEQ